MDECAGCRAKDQEIAYLRARLDRADDTVLAVVNPALYQVVKGVSLDRLDVAPASVGGEPIQREPGGKEYVMIGAERVPLEEYERTLANLDEFMSNRLPMVERNAVQPVAERDAGLPLPL